MIHYLLLGAFSPLWDHIITPAAQEAFSGQGNDSNPIFCDSFLTVQISLAYVPSASLGYRWLQHSKKKALAYQHSEVFSISQHSNTWLLGILCCGTSNRTFLHQSGRTSIITVHVWRWVVLETTQDPAAQQKVHYAQQTRYTPMIPSRWFWRF